MNHEFTINQSYVGLLYEDGAFKQLLEPGKYELGGFFDRTVRTVTYVDMRERSLTLKGQEILTADKVAIRVSLLVYYRVTDPVAAVHNVASYEERIYEDVQLAARRFLATRKLDDILSDRNDISDAVLGAVKSSAATYGVEIHRADVKDLVFPGNLRDIMNQVLETERRAEAKLIQAKKDAEASRVQAEAAAETQQLRVRADVAMQELRSKASQDRARLELVSKLEQAEAIRTNPELLELEKLRALSEMAENGGKFVVGLDSSAMRFANGKDE